jgi:hypothetical protein
MNTNKLGITSKERNHKSEYKMGESINERK